MTPTRSQVENWDTEHLDAAADHWSKTATVWEDRFTQLATQINNPGGTPWEGAAAEAAQHRAYSDRLIVIGLSDQLHDAAAIARKGSTELQEACRLVMRSVQSAENDGFIVGEDFSVTDHHVYSRVAAASRQAKAEGYVADIRAAVADLVTADTRIASEILTAASGLGKDHFGESEGQSAVPGGDQKPVADALSGKMAGNPSKKVADQKVSDAILGNVVGGSGGQQDPLVDSVLANVAGAGSTGNDAAQSALYQIGKAAAGKPEDWAVAAASNYSSHLLNGAMKSARPGTVGSPAWVQKTVGEIKVGKLPFGSAPGLGVTGLFGFVSFLSDNAKPGMTTAHAAVRNGSAVVVGTVVTAYTELTVVGAPGGFVVGTAASNLTAKGVDVLWEAVPQSAARVQELGGAANVVLSHRGVGTAG